MHSVLGPPTCIRTLVPDVVLNKNVDNDVGKVLSAHQQECDHNVVESLIVVQVRVLREQAQNNSQQFLLQLLSLCLRIIYSQEL